MIFVFSCISCDLDYRFFFFFKQKTAYEMRISDWSSDVCSSDLMNHGIDPLIATSKITSERAVWTASGTCSAESWRKFCRQRRILKLAELIGTASKALDGAVAYACEREQFGKTIGVNQAIKHRLADNWMAIDNARLARHQACPAIDRKN